MRLSISSNRILMTNGTLMKDKSIAFCTILTCIKRYLVLNTNFLTFGEWPFYTEFYCI